MHIVRGNDRSHRALAGTSTAASLAALQRASRWEKRRRKGGATAAAAAAVGVGGGAGGVLSSQPALTVAERIPDLLVLELLKDGGREFHRYTVRELYKHVLACICARGGGGGEQREGHGGGENEELEGAPSPGAGKSPRFPRMPRKKIPRVDVSTGMSGGGVTYRERLGGFLHPRDMRRLVTPFSATNEPELIVRRHVMLLNFDPLRAVILRDRLLVLVPEGSDSLLLHLERRVRGGSQEVEKEIFGFLEELDDDGGGSPTEEENGETGNKKKGGLAKLGSLLKRSGSSKDIKALEETKRTAAPSSEVTAAEEDEEEDSAFRDEDEEKEWDEMEGREWIDLPFELQCADAVLYVVTSMLSDDTQELGKAVKGYISRLLSENGSWNDDPLTIIRVVKDAVREMSARVKSFVQSMNRILDEDEDMALMNLSRLLTHPERFIQPVTQEVLEEESDEPELILEANLQIGLSLQNSLDLMQGQIDTVAEMVDQKLDAMRNRILFANMVISVFSLAVTTASLVGSIFGMNLMNFLEDDPNAFRQVTFGTIAGSIVLIGCILAGLFYSGTIPRTRTVPLDLPGEA
jgi:magnesium transporter